MNIIVYVDLIFLMLFSSIFNVNSNKSENLGSDIQGNGDVTSVQSTQSAVPNITKESEKSRDIDLIHRTSDVTHLFDIHFLDNDDEEKPTRSTNHEENSPILSTESSSTRPRTPRDYKHLDVWIKSNVDSTHVVCT